MLLEGETGPRFGFDRDPRDTATFLKKFYDEAGISPDVVEYVEAFGSGKYGWCQNVVVTEDS